jgi:hypothetical protein
MDQSFFLRAKRLLDRRPSVPSHSVLLDHLAAQRASSLTVRASTLLPAAAEPADGSDALCALILAEPEWRIAGRIQRGCFNRSATARRVNRP